jgi:hypothetical protein
MWKGFAGVPDPAVTGVTVYLTREPAGGEPVTIALPASGWRSGRTHRFSGGGGASVRASLRIAGRGGRFTLRTAGTPLVPPGASGVHVLVTLADFRSCAAVAGAEIRETARRLVAVASAPLESCPCPPLPADTFDAIERRVFARHTCTAFGCHGHAPGQAGLSLASGDAWAELVSVPSATDPAQPRVAPGDPEGSMLWRKIAVRTLGLGGVPNAGMPIGDPVVGVGELEAIRQWILAGAPPTGSVPAADVLLDCALP